MITTIKRATAAIALTAASLSLATTAEARDGYYRGHGGGDDAAIAIGAGIVGLAIGAMIADRSDRHYYDRAYYPSRRYVSVRGYPDYYYYYEGYPNRYYRDRYYSRYYAPYYRDRYRSRYSKQYYYDGWNRRRGYDRYSDRRYYGSRSYRNDHRDYRRYSDRHDWRR